MSLDYDEYVQYHRQYQKERNTRLASKGLCIRCAMPTGNGKKMCDYCYKKELLQKQARREERFRNGLCVQCGKPNDNGRSYCFDCRQKDKYYHIMRGVKSD